jgi:hypothetical protein
MQWKKERDLLVAQTLAFVQSVARRKSDLEPDAEFAPIDAVDIEARDFEAKDLEAKGIEATGLEMKSLEAIKVVEPPRGAQFSSVQVPSAQVSSVQVSSAQVARRMVPSEVQTEIQNRIANFRAHQQRFHRERAEYFGTTLSKIRAAIEDASASARPRK